MTEGLFDPWTGAYYTYYRDVMQPGHTETERIVRYQTDVWTTKESGRMVWSGTSQTFDPTSRRRVARDVDLHHIRREPARSDHAVESLLPHRGDHLVRVRIRAGKQLEVNRETARAIVPELAKQGIIPPKRKK